MMHGLSGTNVHIFITDINALTRLILYSFYLNDI